MPVVYTHLYMYIHTHNKTPRLRPSLPATFCGAASRFSSARVTFDDDDALNRRRQRWLGRLIARENCIVQLVWFERERESEGKIGLARRLIWFTAADYLCTCLCVNMSETLFGFIRLMDCSVLWMGKLFLVGFLIVEFWDEIVDVGGFFLDCRGNLLWFWLVVCASGRACFIIGFFYSFVQFFLDLMSIT